jgi:ferritin-like metal-binding protein YciE
VAFRQTINFRNKLTINQANVYPFLKSNSLSIFWNYSASPSFRQQTDKCSISYLVKHHCQQTLSKEDIQMPAQTQTEMRKSAPKRKSSTDEKKLDDLFEHALKDIYYAEKKILKALPKMIKAAHDDGLREGLESHRQETEGHVSKLEQVFSILGKSPKAVKCEAIDGILSEADGVLKDFGKSKACDAAIIFSGQAVEHYEITRYGSMHAWATSLGIDDAAEILESILEEEKAADSKLTDLAESRINFAAEEEDEAAGDLKE